MKTHAPFAAAAERQSKLMTTTHLKAAFYATTATTARQSFANTGATESGQTIMQAQTVCRSATPATMITIRPANAAAESFTVIMPITMMTMITPIATGVTRNVRTAPFTNITTSPTPYFTVTQSAISAWNLKSTRVARTVTMLIRFWVSATGLRSISTSSPTEAFQTAWKS